MSAHAGQSRRRTNRPTLPVLTESLTLALPKKRMELHNNGTVLLGRDLVDARTSPSLSKLSIDHRSNLEHFSDVSVGCGDRHFVVRSIQRFPLRTFSLGDSTEGREQDRTRAESIRTAPTDRVDTATHRLS